MNTSRRGNGRSEVQAKQSPFIGAAPALEHGQRGVGVFADLLNVDVFKDHLESRKPFIFAGPSVGTGLTNAVSTCVWDDSGDYVLTWNPTLQTLTAAKIDSDSKQSYGLGFGSENCQLVRSDKSAVLFSDGGNGLVSLTSGTLSARALGLSNYAKFGSMDNPFAKTYKLYRYGIEVCRKTDGVITESSSIRRCSRNSKFVTSGGGFFSLAYHNWGYYDVVRIWRSMQLNVTADSLNNVAVGSQDELYLVATIPVDSLPTTAGGTYTIGKVVVTKYADDGWWSFVETLADDDLDDTTVQTIDSINLSPFPACPSGCHAGGRYWGVVDGGVAYSLPGGTIYRELFDPLNVLSTPGEQPTAIVEFYGDVIVFTAGSTWRITAADPVNGISKITSFGVAKPSHVGVLEGIGVFAVCQDQRCRIMTTSLSLVESVGGISFSEHVGKLFSNGCSVVAHCGDIYVADLTAGLWKLNLSSGCGWSRYSMASDTFCGAVVYADGAKIAFIRASDRRPFRFLTGSSSIDVTSDGGQSQFSCSVVASLDAGRGYFELRDVCLRALSHLSDVSTIVLSAVSQGQSWTPDGAAPYGVVAAGTMSELQVLAPRATAYRARPVGRWMTVSLSYRGGVDLYEFILNGVMQETVRAGWNPLAIFAGA